MVLCLPIDSWSSFPRLAASRSGRIVYVVRASPRAISCFPPVKVANQLSLYTFTSLPFDVPSITYIHLDNIRDASVCTSCLGIHCAANRPDSLPVCAIEQPISTPFGSNTYPKMMEAPGSLPLRTISSGPITPDSRQRSFHSTLYFDDMPQEILNFPVTMVSESSLDPWLMEMPGTASPGSSRLSTSPSQDISTPSSDGFYSPSYPEQLQLPSYHFVEQPQPLRAYSTSHPNWVSNGENWERNYAEREIWAAQPFVTRPWLPNTYESYASTHMTTGHASVNNSAPTFYTYAAASHFQSPEVIETAAISEARCFSADLETCEEEDSSDEESEHTHCESSASRSKPKTMPSRPHIDRWSVSIPNIQQSETRGHLCNIPGCKRAFVRPEHLRRHVRSKHLAERIFPCKIPDCMTAKFTRGDNLRDHYWTHLDRGGRAGKNKKYTLLELREFLGPKEKKLVRRLREKLRQHLEKEKLKKQQVIQPVCSDHPSLQAI